MGVGALPRVKLFWFFHPFSKDFRLEERQDEGRLQRRHWPEGGRARHFEPICLELCVGPKLRPVEVGAGSSSFFHRGASFKVRRAARGSSTASKEST